MSNQPDDAVRLPPEVESQLNERLAVWARARRLGSADLEAIRGLVLARVAEPLPSEFAAESASAELVLSELVLSELVSSALVSSELVSSELVSSELDPRSAFDSEWLWSLLRPVAALMEWKADVGAGNLSDRVERWLQPLTGDRAYQPYLQLG